MIRAHLAVVALLLWLCPVFTATAAPPTAPVVPEAAKASVHFDVEAATNAWLASVPADRKTRSDSYFEGGYWLLLWDFLFSAVLMIVLLETGFSAQMREWAVRITRFKALQSWIYWAEFTLVGFVVTLPLSTYEGYFREHQYGLSNLTFGGWFKEQSIGLTITIVLGGLAFMAFAAVVRRLPDTWHVWGAAVGIVFVALTVVIFPVFLAPLFNTYKPLAETPLKARILILARSNGIPATDVYQMDASKQSNRVSANVSGFFGTERITLNDNLLARCSPEAVLSTMGHEMGHYVLRHVYNNLFFTTFLVVLMFWALRHGLREGLARYQTRWKLLSVSDVAVLPLALLILSILSFLVTPVTNSFIREQEYQADIYGLNAARQPDGEAEIDLLLGEYRKLDPAPLEELIFFDHPSGRTRIQAAMRWKAGNLCLFDASLACANTPITLIH